MKLRETKLLPGKKGFILGTFSQGYNTAIDEIGAKEIELDVEKTAKVLFEQCHVSKWEAATQRQKALYLNWAKDLSAALPRLLKSQTKDGVK